jgi:hypothetical protein
MAEISKNYETTMDGGYSAALSWNLRVLLLFIFSKVTTIFLQGTSIPKQKQNTLPIIPVLRQL